MHSDLFCVGRAAPQRLEEISIQVYGSNYQSPLLSQKRGYGSESTREWPSPDVKGAGDVESVI